MLCSRQMIVSSGVTVLFLLIVQSKQRIQGLRDLLSRFTGVEWTEHILVTMNLLQILLHVLDCGFSMVPVLCPQVKINQVVDAQQGLSEGNRVACRRVGKSRHENWKNHLPECCHLSITPCHHPAIWLV